MKSINNMFLGLFFVIFTQGCATVGMAIDGGKELVTDTVDTVVGTASKITIACLLYTSPSPRDRG